MAKALNIGILRPGSPPLNVCLVAEHLPSEVRTALEQLAQARVDLSATERDFAGATAENFTELDEAVRGARQTADKAMTDFVAVNAASSTAIRDSGHAAFSASIESANTYLQQALDALAEASQAAALVHSVTPGRAVLCLDSRAFEESTARKSIAMARSLLADVREFVPDGLD